MTWIGFSPPAYSQVAPTEKSTADVVVNGRKVLAVQAVAGFTAAERADSINQRLKEEVQSSESTEIEIVVDEEINLAYLQSRSSNAL
ncbi:MAG: hypothetical protein AAFW95_05535, partial [Cyanobacteria bacterium J06638_6]